MVSKIVSTFALAFEKSLLLANIKKEFFERFYINRQVVQEADASGHFGQVASG